MSTAPSESQPESTSSEPQPTALQHVAVERDGLAVCTMFPADCEDADVTSEWITAGPDAYCSLEDAR